jgi:lipoprotein-anchoring transpeptidase ErfK/SrfK
MKKFLPHILIFILLITAGVLNPIFQVKASTGNPSEPCTYDSVTDTTPNNSPCVPKYNLLVPLPCPPDSSGNTDPSCDTQIGGQKILTGFNSAQTNSNGKSVSLGAYLNLIIRIFIGLCAVLATVMIVIGGMEYMTSDLISSKEAGKDRIRNAILGLLLALGAYAILYTINPAILNNTDPNISTATIVVVADEALLNRTDGPSAVATAGTKYVTTKGVSSGVTTFTQSNSSLTSVTVNATDASPTATFCNGSNCVSVPINIGLNGTSAPGTAQGGDGKTPLGTTTITSTTVGSGGNAVLSKDGVYNLGSAAVYINETINGADRGIAFHGSANDNLGTTNGCIRMSNADLAALAPLMKPGMQVVIK